MSRYTFGFRMSPDMREDLERIALSVGVPASFIARVAIKKEMERIIREGLTVPTTAVLTSQAQRGVVNEAQ